VPLRDDLLPIGRLARLSRLSIKALRVYEREQLLIPAWTDPHNGYRYYAPAQVRTGGDHRAAAGRQACHWPTSDDCSTPEGEVAARGADRPEAADRARHRSP
jgi:hypothetical protein